MNKIFTFLAVCAVSTTLMLGGISDAEAKRFGGARSFGGKSAFNMPYRRSVSPGKTSRSASQQKAYQKNQAARQNMSRRGGLMGMLGALAIGGLLGSLFFGGAFEGINFMDILLFAGIGYLLYRIFAARSKPAPAQAQGWQRNSFEDDTPQSSYQKNSAAGFDTDVLFKKNRNEAGLENMSGQDDADFDNQAIPEGFDEQAFLEGAKKAFYQLQKAWDERDLAEIRGLTTDKVFAEIQEMLKASDEDNKTEILKLDAELLDVRELENELEAVVLFDSIMREDDQQAAQVREVWHFIKPKYSVQAKWFLDGIQQLEE